MNDYPNTTKQEMWSILMRLADPSDLLRTILNDSGNLPHPNLAAFNQQALVFTGCTVHIHQHVAPPPGHDTIAQAAAAVDDRS